MDVRVTRLRSGAVQIAPVGILDETTIGELRPHLLDRHESILLDLSGVSSIDDAAMALVLLARLEIEAAGGAFVVQAPDPKLAHAIDRAGLSRFVDVASDRIDALRAIRQPGAIAA